MIWSGQKKKKKKKRCPQKNQTEPNVKKLIKTNWFILKTKS